MVAPCPRRSRSPPWRSGAPLPQHCCRRWPHAGAFVCTVGQGGKGEREGGREEGGEGGKAPHRDLVTETFITIYVLYIYIEKNTCVLRRFT